MLQDESSSMATKAIGAETAPSITSTTTTSGGGGQQIGGSLPSVASTGNLLSNVAPPVALPNFYLPPSPPTTTTTNQQQQQSPLPGDDNDRFVAAIPPDKGAPIATTTMAAQLQRTNRDGAASGGLFNWMRDAVVSGGGGLISKMVATTMHSMDSMITTLDPQMREFIHSGGDVYILVAMEARDDDAVEGEEEEERGGGGDGGGDDGDEEVVGAVRSAFQHVFGKATVDGKRVVARQRSEAAAATTPSSRNRSIGYEVALRAATERIDRLLGDLAREGAVGNRRTDVVGAAAAPPPVVVVAVENFDVELAEDCWYNLDAIVLKDARQQQQHCYPGNHLVLKTFTQTFPLPRQQQQHVVEGGGEQQQRALVGVSRRDAIQLAARVLANLYKNAIAMETTMTTTTTTTMQKKKSSSGLLSLL